MNSTTTHRSGHVRLGFLLGLVSALAAGLALAGCDRKTETQDDSPYHEERSEVEADEVLEARELKRGVRNDKKNDTWEKEREELQEGAELTRRDNEIWFQRRRLERLEDRFTKQASKEELEFEERYAIAEKMLDQLDKMYGEVEPDPSEKYKRDITNARELVDEVEELVN